MFEFDSSSILILSFISKETSNYAKGFRFDPFDEEFISDYLKPMIMRKHLQCDFIKFRQVYGTALVRIRGLFFWMMIDLNWFFSPHLKDIEKCMFVFSKL